MDSKDEAFRSSLTSSFKALGEKTISYFSLPKLRLQGYAIDRLPFSIRILLESLVRNLDGKEITRSDVEALAGWNAKAPADRDVPFKVARILMQDFTGVPAVVDIAAIRDYIKSAGKDPETVQPTVPVDLIIDHSVQVDVFAAPGALQENQQMEMKRNKERYSLLKWASGSFDKFRVFPPSAGICHQINLEYLASVATTDESDGKLVAYPDTLVGTDSHTTMINGLGVVGFGVGGIEAEAAMLGQAVSIVTPRVLGVRLSGSLAEGVTATDFALTLTRKLREKGVVNMFVEFFGDGVGRLSLPDRATLSNMCPEYGATVAIFPVDTQTLDYLTATGRSKEHVELVEQYYRSQEMLGIDYSKVAYSDILEVDLGSITPCVSGPSQPKQEIPLGDIGSNFADSFLGQGVLADPISSVDATRWSSESAHTDDKAVKAAPRHKQAKKVHLVYDDGYETDLSDGDVVISSITSCTNTSNPSVMIGAGILAKKALEKGLMVDTRKVKTSLGPGSRVVMKYLEKAGLIDPLAKLGYGLVGYGCITCIGNSGPLIDKQSDAINANDIAVAAVLSGNRNYAARIHRDVRANYLMSPPLLIAFAIAGTVRKDLTTEPLGKGTGGKDIYLRDIWPTSDEINKAIKSSVSMEIFENEYGSGISGVNPYWNGLPVPTGVMYEWDANSTYIRLPPFFGGFKPKAVRSTSGITNAMVLAVFGDSVSTDHLSPAGAIGKDSPAGKYLLEHGVQQKDFNTYGTRRGNHEVMMRGTFANNRIRNLMMDSKEGGFTIYYPDGEQMTIYDAAMKYAKQGTPLVVLAGAEYGSGSSRDWAAKGPMLLGVRAVIAGSFERIHRSNLVGMGILPLQFMQGDSAESLKIDYTKPINVIVPENMRPREAVRIEFTDSSGEVSSADVISRLDTALDIEYYRTGGILNYVIKKMMA